MCYGCSSGRIEDVVNGLECSSWAVVPLKWLLGL